MCEELYMTTKSKPDVAEEKSNEEMVGTVTRSTTFTYEFNARLNKMVLLRGHLSGSEFIRIATIEKMEREENMIVAQTTWDLIGAQVIKKIMLDQDIKISDIRESVRVMTQQYQTLKKEGEMIKEGSDLDIDNQENDEFNL